MTAPAGRLAGRGANSPQRPLQLVLDFDWRDYYTRERAEEGGKAPADKEADMTVEPKAKPQTSSIKVKQVISYRVAVKDLARALRSLANTGSVSQQDLARLEEISRGK